MKASFLLYDVIIYCRMVSIHPSSQICSTPVCGYTVSRQLISSQAAKSVPVFLKVVITFSFSVIEVVTISVFIVKSNVVTTFSSSWGPKHWIIWVRVQRKWQKMLRTKTVRWTVNRPLHAPGADSCTNLSDTESQWTQPDSCNWILQQGYCMSLHWDKDCWYTRWYLNRKQINGQVSFTIHWTNELLFCGNYASYLYGFRFLHPRWQTLRS